MGGGPQFPNARQASVGNHIFGQDSSGPDPYAAWVHDAEAHDGQRPAGVNSAWLGKKDLKKYHDVDAWDGRFRADAHVNTDGDVIRSGANTPRATSEFGASRSVTPIGTPRNGYADSYRSGTLRRMAIARILVKHFSSY